MRLVVVIGLAAGLLAGCEARNGGAQSEPVLATELAKPVMRMVPERAADGGAVAPGSPAPTITLPMLAYVYEYGIEAPTDRIRGLVAGHEAACAAAGPAQCQVTSSTVTELGEDSLRGVLELRASAAWVKRLRDGLPGETRAAGGRVTSSRVSSEDLSRQIVDTEARVRAMTTLRDRLMALLAERPGKLADVVAIEQELARVQGEIDSTASQLAVMRGRVQMSTVTLSYGSKGSIAPDGVWSPLVSAFEDFIGIIAVTLGGMVRVLAWLLPWLALGGGILWLFRKRLRANWGRPKPPPATPPEAS